MKNENYMEQTDDVNNDMMLSGSLLNSIESFVLTPPRQILADTEKELDLDVVNPGVIFLD